MEMLRLLATEHQQIDRLLKQLQAARESAERRWLFIELKHRLKIHARLEEEIFYPALRDDRELDHRIEESMARHEAMRALLAQMEETVPGSSRWVESLRELISKLEQHVREEESEFFPKARASLTPRLQEDLFERMLVRKAQLAGGGAESAVHGEGETSARANQTTGQSAVGQTAAGQTTSGQAVPGSTTAGPEQASTSQTSARVHEYSYRTGRQGAAAMEQGVGAVAEQTRRVADALHQTGEHLAQEDQEGLSYYLREAADSLNRFSNRLTRGDVDDLLREARDTARRNPALLLGGAIAAGFLLTRFIKSSGMSSSPETASGSVQPGAAASSRAPAGETPRVPPRAAPKPPPSHPQEVR